MVGAIFSGILAGGVVGGLVGATVWALPTLGSFGASGLALAGGGAIATSTAIETTATLLGALIVFERIVKNGGPKNGTLSNGNSTGYYDENGNLTERVDTKGTPHYIKKLGNYFLPHTHHYRWEFVKGIWRVIKYWVSP